MNKDKKLQNLLGPQESTRIVRALDAGMTRREVLAMLVAGGGWHARHASGQSGGVDLDSASCRNAEKRRKASCGRDYCINQRHDGSGQTVEPERLHPGQHVL